VLQSPWQCS